MKRGFTLLLADDDENDVTFFKVALEESSQKAGVPVRLALTRDGEEALAYLKGEGEFSDRTKHPFPEIVVTDLKLPRLNGLGVLAWLKKHEEYQRIPKILLSGSSEECDVDEAYQLGANTFFQNRSRLRSFRNWYITSCVIGLTRKGR
jgi:CheY-like chemotaxis protein